MPLSLPRQSSKPLGAQQLACHRERGRNHRQHRAELRLPQANPWRPPSLPLKLDGPTSKGAMALFRV